MENKFSEAEKNFFVCAALMAICGVGMLLMSKVWQGVLCVTLAVIFLIVPIVMHIKGDGTDVKSDKSSDEKR